MKKVIKITLIVLLALVLVLCSGIFCLWGNEIRSILSLQKHSDSDPSHSDGYIYEMEIYGDYAFDEFLAQGGASTDGELIGFVTQSITKGLIPMNMEQPEISCSSFTATAADGDQLFGRNYDFSKTNTCIVRTNPGKGRYSSVSTIDLTFLSIDKEKGIQSIMDKVLCLAAPYAPLDGVNEAGLACGIYMSYQGGEKTVATNQITDKPDLTSTTMLRMILDYCATVEEAIAMVEQYDLHDSAGTSFHYMIADAQGNSAVLEWVAGTDSTDNDGTLRQLNVIRNTDREDPAFQCVTNCILTPGYYEADDDRGGYDRLQHLEARLTETEGKLADEEAAMDLLAEVGRRTWLVDGDRTSGLTIHSVVYNLTDRTIYWVGNEHYGDPAYTHRYTLGK